MSQTTDLNYVLDRITIQDLIGKYGLGQDLHQPDDKDQNVLEQWSQVFASDAVIDASSVGYGDRIDLIAYAEMKRGKGLNRLPQPAPSGLRVRLHCSEGDCKPARYRQNAVLGSL